MIARILAFSVERRWLVVLLTLAASGFGIWSLGRLPIDAVPDITNKQVQINSVAPALSPVDVERQVTFPVETALAGIPGLEYTRSLSRNGFSQVTAVFGERTDIYFARQQVAERLADAARNLPTGVRPQMSPISSGLGEVYMWSISFKTGPDRPATRPGEAGWQRDGSYLTPEGQILRSDFERATYLRTVQDWIIRPQIRTVPGVAGVDTIGGYEKQYVVQPDPAKLIGFNISFNELAEALESNNSNRGAGYIERNGEGFNVRINGRLDAVDQVSTIVVATRDGVPIRVSDLASVAIGRELRTGSGSANGTEAVIGTAMMLIGENSRTVAAAVDARIQQINRSLPAGIEAKPVLNRMVLVDATITTVAKNLAEGALLVVLVLFLMLGNIRAALITALVIPIAMLMTMAGMVQGRISANLMSLGALDFGLIVDGAVIIAENALRRIAEHQHELGRPLKTSERARMVVAAAEEMIRPSVYGQAIIILVYVPLLTFSGVEGKMFEPMALTVILALAAAFVISITFIPAVLAIAITGKVQEKDNFIVRALRTIYAPLLKIGLRVPSLFIGAAILLLVACIALFTRMGQEFLPQLDEKNIAMHALRIPSVSLAQSQAMQLDVERAVSRFPQVAYVFSKTGTAEVAADPMPPNASDTFIILKPQSEWPDPSLGKQALIERIQAEVEKLVGNNYEFTQPIQMRFNELLAGVRGDLAVKVFGDDFEPMLRAANQIAAVLRNTQGAQDVKVEQVGGLPALEISINRSEIARLGLSVQIVQDVIGAAVGGREAGVIFEGDRRFPLIVRLPEALRQDIEHLRHLPLPMRAEGGRAGASIPLEQVASLAFVEGPNQISRENGKRRVVVTANVRGRDIASVVEEAQAKVQRISLPSGYYVTWGGQFENLAAARNRLMIVVPVCFLLILVLLTSALQSFRDALLVFSAVPLALTGGILALWLRGMPFSVAAAVGFIALSGVAVLNGLVMLTYMKQLVAEGRPLRDAIIEGAMTRLRPVIMTALVASLGFVPMALATGTGAEVQKPLATVVIGGLISATILTLLIAPLLYSLFGDRRVATSDTEEP